MIVWVDDIITVANNKTEIDRAEAEMKSKYTVKVIGEPTMLLGIHITRDRTKRMIKLSQSHYIRQMLKDFGMENANPISMPMDPNVALQENQESGGDSCASQAYATAISKLLYAAHATRPDILYAVVTLAQFTKNPSPVHWTAVKRVYRYLKGTMNFVLTYGGRDQSWLPELSQYVDADGGTNPHQKSISGYVFTIAGGAVAWSSKKQSTTALSTAEAEYVAATHATKQVLWHRYLFEELGFEQPEKSILWSDNQAAIAISHNPEFHARTKHIDINLHFLRDHVEAGTLELKHIPSKRTLLIFSPRGYQDNYTRI